MLNLEFTLNLGERMYCMMFEKLRKNGGKKIKEEQPRKKVKKGVEKKMLRTKVKEFNTICLEEVEKYEKKRSLKCMLIKLTCVVANACV